jgi:hypothetical protein
MPDTDGFKIVYNKFRCFSSIFQEKCYLREINDKPSDIFSQSLLYEVDFD